MKTACIFIAAYNCPAYIMDCVQSIRGQRPAPGWQLDVRIGVDGCTRTADVLRKNKVPFYWSEKNHGAYIIRNSLIHLRPADAYIWAVAARALTATTGMVPTSSATNPSRWMATSLISGAGRRR